MKVAAFLEDPISSGGGFNQTLNATLQMARLCKGRFEFEVITPRADNIPFLRQLGIEATLHRATIVERAIGAVLRADSMLGLRRKSRWLMPLEKRLLDSGCDLVYFTSPSAKAVLLQRLNYIVTLWDVCHRDSPEFPESRQFSEVLARDAKYRSMLAGALAVITDSEQLAAKVSRRYGIDRERLLAMPFAPAPLLEQGQAERQADVLSVYGLSPGYYFYPAQFWAHKNHVRILEAMARLKERGLSRDVVFSGRDGGNLAHVEATARRLGVSEQVRMLGFVPARHMRGLYEGCAAVVVPTYFGPTNIPPLEAWLMKRPLVYSNTCSDQAGDAALVVDPDDADALADAMERVLDPVVGKDLVERGARRLDDIAEDRTEAEGRLLGLLNMFSKRRECWA